MSADGRTQFELVESFWQQLVALDERIVRQATRRVARRRLIRTLALALLGLVAAAALAVAAATWIFGSAAPPVLGPLEQGNIGTLTPGSVRLLGVRVADPVEGPAWSLRVFKTSKRRVCFQVGRVVDGQLVALGVAGAFDDDRQAHALPIEHEACGTLESRRPTRFGAVSQVTSTSGLVGPEGCRDPCSSRDRRTIVFGMLGRRPASVTMLLKGERYEMEIPERAYLFVLPGALDAGEARFIVTDRDGGECEMDNPAGDFEQLRNHFKSPIRPRCDGAALT